MAGHVPPLPYLVLLALAAAVQYSNSASEAGGGGGGGEYCSQGARLSTKFMVPFYESHLNVSRDRFWIAERVGPLPSSCLN